MCTGLHNNSRRTLCMFYLNQFIAIITTTAAPTFTGKNAVDFTWDCDHEGEFPLWTKFLRDLSVSTQLERAS